MYMYVTEYKEKFRMPWRGRRGLDRIVGGFSTICAISAYHRSWRGVLDTTLCDKVCQWFSPITLVSSTNKTDRHDISELLLKVALNTINQTKPNQNAMNTKSKEKEPFLIASHCSGSDSGNVWSSEFQLICYCLFLYGCWRSRYSEGETNI